MLRPLHLRRSWLLVGAANEEDPQQEQDNVAYGYDDSMVGGGEAKDIHLDEQSGAYYSYNTRTGSTSWVQDRGDKELGSGTSHETETPQVDENEARQTHFDAESGAYYSYNTRSGSTRWLQEVVESAGVPASAAPENEGTLYIDMATLEERFTVDKSKSRGEWSVMVDDASGETVYLNNRTKQILSKKPKGWVRMLMHLYEGGNAGDT